MINKKFKRTFTYGQVCAWAIMCLLPVIGVCLSTKNAFPKTNQFANVSLAVELGASLIFLYYSSTPREINPWIARYCVIGEFLLSLALWANFGIHFQFTRDIDAAEQSIQESNKQGEIASRLREEESTRLIRESEQRRKETETQTKNINAQNRQIAMLPKGERRNPIIQPPLGFVPNASPSPILMGTIKTTGSIFVQIFDPQKVRQDWYWYLWIALLISAGFSILGIAGLVILWKWEPPSLPPSGLSETTVLNRPKNVLEIVPESSLENVLTVPRIATSCVPESSLGQNGNGKNLEAVWDGREWKVLGYSLPNIANVRYVAKPGRGSIEVIPFDIGTNDGTNYLTNLSKSFLDKTSKLSKEKSLEEIRKKVNVAKEAKGIPVS